MIRTYRDKWVKALRSGKFHQTRGTLRRKRNKKPGYGYCCLGVLMEVCKLPQKRMDFLSKDNLKKVGLGESTQRKLAEMNDDDHLKFKKIANYIEENL